MDNSTTIVPKAYLDFLSVCNIVIFFEVLLGNALTVRITSENENLKTTSNQVIKYLAVSDMLCSLIFLLLMLPVFILPRDDKTILPFLHCSQIGVTMNFVGCCVTYLSSMLHILLVAVERYIYIKRPLHYALWVTEKRLLIATCTIWMFSIIVSSTQFVFISFKTSTHSACATRSKINGAYTLTCASVSYVIVSAILVVFFREISNLVKAKTNRSNPLDRSIKSVPQKSRGIKLLILVIIVYLIGWGPLLIMSFLEILYFNHGNVIVQSVTYSFTVLAFLSFAVNMPIYAWQNAELREGYKRFFCKLKRQRIQPA